MLDHPLTRPDAGAIVVTVGGPALFLIGNLMFKHAIWRAWPAPYLVSLPALGVLALAAPASSRWAG